MANPAMKIIGKASTEYVDSPATLKGTITKAFGLTLVTIASAIASGVFLANSPAAYGVLILGMIVGVVLTLVTCFKPHLAPMTTPGYAVFEGAVLGIISAQFERMYFGISAIAVGITLATMILMLVLWKTRIIKVTVEFIHLRGRLANYFDESHKEDIFDYVPPQKTNQIFTPRKVVVEMVNMLEQENPGCFDDPTYTFADLYMKSGMYITEIIKRLYNSEAMRRYFPDNHIRLAHILEHQVYGIAPTEIIYQIATHYILGYNNELGKGLHTHFAMADSAQLAKEGKLAEFVDETFGE